MTYVRRAVRERIARDMKASIEADTINPSKGKQDGCCNRTACQMPLAGRQQWWRTDYGTDGPRLFYCQPCAFDFNTYDERNGYPPRCTRLEAI